MTLEDCYAKLNGSYAEAKTRLMNDTLIDRFIRRFPSDPSMQLLRDKVKEGSNAEAFRAVHTLKVVAANLAFTRLQQEASALTELMRDQVTPADPQMMAAIEESYQLVLDTLEEYIASN